MLEQFCYFCTWWPVIFDWTITFISLYYVHRSATKSIRKVLILSPWWSSIHLHEGTTSLASFCHFVDFQFLLFLNLFVILILSETGTGCLPRQRFLSNLVTFITSSTNCSPWTWVSIIFLLFIETEVIHRLLLHLFLTICKLYNSKYWKLWFIKMWFLSFLMLSQG